MKKTLLVIPARAASSRFPNKPLATIAGQTLLQRVYHIAKATKQHDQIIIATDSETIAQHAQSFGATVMITPQECETGTDRVAVVAEKMGPEYELIISLQGDAVLTPPWIIDELTRTLQNDPSLPMATPAQKLSGAALIAFSASKRSGSTTGTSVVFDRNHQALYFSKNLIPKTRDAPDNAQLIYQHIGLYAYRRDILLQYSALPRGRFEQAEKLEQLRALENGIPIHIVEVDCKGHTLHSVDEPEDIPIVEEIIRREGELC